MPSALVKSNSFQLPARDCFAGTQTLDFLVYSEMFNHLALAEVHLLLCNLQ